MSTKTLLTTITSKGQITLPVAIRRRLGLNQHDRVAFVMDESGRVELQVPRYASVASLTGAAGSLETPLSMTQMREIAHQDRFRSLAEDND